MKPGQCTLVQASTLRAALKGERSPGTAANAFQVAAGAPGDPEAAAGAPREESSDYDDEELEDAATKALEALVDTEPND